MPKNRIQFSDDFVLNNNKVGIGSSAPQEALDVNSIAKGENLRVTGVSSISGYEGFLRSNHAITENTNLTEGQGISGSLSGEIIVGTGVTVTIVSAGVGTTTVGVGSTGTITNTLSPSTITTSGQGQVDSLKVYNMFMVPVGGIADRPTAPKPGMLFYNKDFATIEFYTGDAWRQVDNRTTSGRAVVGGGFNGSSAMGSIEYLNISSLGNGQDFGTLLTARFQHGSCSSSTRGLWCGGSPATNVIEYITIASSGNGLDFGDSTLALSQRHGGLSSSTRGIFNSGLQTSPANLTINVIEYVQISTLGDALDFGDLSKARFDLAAFSSSTRGIFAGGFNENDLKSQSVIDFITISSKGDAVRFGDLSVSRRSPAGGSNSTRAIIAGGATPSVQIDTIEYLTIASLGNTIDFGKLSSIRSASKAAASQSRMLIIGGDLSGVQSNSIEYVQISTLGNSQDFGDLAFGGQQRSSLSDSHGGLGGF